MTNDASSVQPKTRADLEQVPTYAPGKAVPGALKIAPNETAQPPLPLMVRAISQTIADSTTSPSRYPNMGAIDLRTKFGKHLGLPMEQVAVGCDSSALYLQLVRVTYTDGDEVVFSWRSFEAYLTLARVTGATPVPVPLDVQGRNDLPAMATAITDYIRLVFVCNLNSPTNTTITHETFVESMAQVPGGVVVALDEAYIELVDEATHAATPLAHGLLGTYPNLVDLCTFSKIYGSAELRVGYMSGPEKLVKAVSKVTIPFSVNTFAQIAAPTSLDVQEGLSTRIAEVCAQRVAVTEAINAATGRETVLPNLQANFIWIDKDQIADLSLLDDVLAVTTTDLGDFLAQRNILIRCSAGEGAHTITIIEEETLQLLATLRIEC